MILRLFIAVFVHFAFFVCFPYTGDMGIIYGLLSLLLWFGLIMFVSMGLTALGLLLGPLKFLVEIVFAASVAFSVATTLPQSDSVSPFEKLRRGRYPTEKTIKIGLAGFGIVLPDTPKEIFKK